MKFSSSFLRPAKRAARRTALRQLAGSALAVLLMTGGAQLLAQPAGKIIRIIVPYAAGGGTDILARHLAEALGTELSNTVIVENRAGASGNIGADYVAKAAPDGTTLLLGDLALAVNPSLFKRMPFDPMKDLQPIAGVAVAPLVMVIGPGVTASNVKELVSFAKANPGRLSFASAGNGNPPHIAGELFRTETGTDMIHVPYKGVGPALTDVIGGQVSMLFTGLSSARPQIDAGKIRALAVTGARRAPTLPAVPTMAEAGFPKVDVTSWWGLFASAGTPPEVAKAIASATQKALGQPRLKERLAVQAIDPEFADAASLRAKLKSESERWGRVIRAANIVPE